MYILEKTYDTGVVTNFLYSLFANCMLSDTWPTGEVDHREGHGQIVDGPTS